MLDGFMLLRACPMVGEGSRSAGLEEVGTLRSIGEGEIGG